MVVLVLVVEETEEGSRAANLEQQLIEARENFEMKLFFF